MIKNFQETSMALLGKLCSAIVAAALPLSAAMADPAVVMAPGGAGGGYDAAARVPLQVMQETGGRHDRPG
jgi:putative tricarboxylic transport membrane protein